MKPLAELKLEELMIEGGYRPGTPLYLPAILGFLIDVMQGFNDGGSAGMHKT